MNSRAFSIRLLAVAALAFSAACSVSASGKIPCADDSSCPADYPACKAGACVESPSGASGTASVPVDNTAPTVSTPATGAGALTPANVRPGTLVTMDLKPNEALSALSVSVLNSSSTLVGQMADVTVASADGTHHLGFAISGGLA